MNPETIPYVVHEDAMVRQERTIRRLWILCIIIFIAFVASNVAWMYYESQFAEEVVQQEVVQDAQDGGTVRYSGTMVGGDYGETDNPADN